MYLKSDRNYTEIILNGFYSNIRINGRSSKLASSFATIFFRLHQIGFDPLLFQSIKYDVTKVWQWICCKWTVLLRIWTSFFYVRISAFIKIDLSFKKMFLKQDKKIVWIKIENEQYKFLIYKNLLVCQNMQKSGER